MAASATIDLYLSPCCGREPALTSRGFDAPTLSAAAAYEAQNVLIGILGQPWLMVENWIVYGHEAGTRADLFFDDQESVEVRLRIVPGEFSDGLIDALCRLARQLNCNFFSVASGLPIEPRRDTILHNLSGATVPTTFNGKSHSVQ